MAARGLKHWRQPGGTSMSIQVAATAHAAHSASRPAPAPAKAPPAATPRVLQSARQPAQLSFFFKRG